VAPLAFTYDYFSERATPDCPLDWVAYRAAEHSPFALMCADVTAALAAEPLDLVAVAHTDPDCAPDISIAGFLAARRGDTPVVVAFSDQGRLAPFSALQVALAYRQHQARFQAVLVALRQAAAPYAAPGREAGGMDEAVGVLLGDTGDIELAGLHQFVDVEPESMLGLLATRLPADLVEPVRVLWTGLPGITGLLASRSATARTVPVECRPGHLWRHLASELASRPGFSVIDTLRARRTDRCQSRTVEVVVSSRSG